MFGIYDTNVNWNVFRYVADFLHFGGLVYGLSVIHKTQSVAGFSKKSQILFQAVYLTRYLDVLVESQETYLFFFKVSFNLITMATLAAFSTFASTYDAYSDSCNMLGILVPVAMASWIWSSGTSVLHEMWTFSEFLEPFALVPQYIVCYTAKNLNMSALFYVFVVGGYRFFYVLNWIYKRYMLSSSYHDYTSWLGGGLECILFVDFVSRISQRREASEELRSTAIGRLVLGLDGWTIGLAEKVEMKFLGRRLPYDISGHVQEGCEMARFDTMHAGPPGEHSKLLSSNPSGGHGQSEAYV